MNTKSYAQDVVYEHKISTRWCTDEHKMMHTDVVYEDKNDAQDEHKMLFMNTK